MPKSRRRKRPKAGPAGMPSQEEILREQREAFRHKFGRDWGPGPVFFDPDADEPTFMSPVKVQAEILEAMRKANLPPQFAYAYRKTGLLGLGDMSGWPRKERKEWNDAIDEYFAIEAARQETGAGSSNILQTEIPELLASPFDAKDQAQVKEVLAAAHPIEARGMKLVARIELAALFLVSACDHAFDSAEDTGGNPVNLFDMAERLVVQRARELYARGPAP